MTQPHYRKSLAVMDQSYDGHRGVTTRLPLEVYQQLDRHARAVDIPVSKAAAQLIEECLNVKNQRAD